MAQSAAVPAAQYLRMSTELQQYSLENQSAAIAKYAELHGFHIVETYADAAKSGVVLARRAGLQRLLRDVVGTSPGFRAVLVYDVSRWGRFQDSDEAAHYEFLCRSAGAAVHYCAETFVNDGTLGSSIMKALKRSMAGEYSRELGVKVLAGQKRLALRGMKQGGSPGYGLRRMLVSGDGARKQLLAPGERKSISTDRVILVHGPEHEVEVVRGIFRMLISESLAVSQIARKLNTLGIRFLGRSRWCYQAVHNILTHPKYCGVYVFARTSSKLSTPTVKMPKSEWVFAPGACEPIVQPSTFDLAQRTLAARTINRTNDEVLDDLRRLLAVKNRLSLSLVKNTVGMPSPSTYRHRFGNLGAAYDLVGYSRAERFGPLETRARTRAIRRDVIEQVAKLFGEDVSVSRRSKRWRERLETKDGCTISVLIARATRTARGAARWIVEPHPVESASTTLLVRLSAGNAAVMDFHVFSRVGTRRRFFLERIDRRLERGCKLSKLGQLCRAADYVAMHPIWSTLK